MVEKDGLLLFIPVNDIDPQNDFSLVKPASDPVVVGAARTDFEGVANALLQREKNIILLTGFNAMVLMVSERKIP